MELIGIPHQIVIGDKSLEKDLVEYRNRQTNQRDDISADNLGNHLLTLLGKSAAH